MWSFNDFGSKFLISALLISIIKFLKLCSLFHIYPVLVFGLCRLESDLFAYKQRFITKAQSTISYLCILIKSTHMDTPPTHKSYCMQEPQKTTNLVVRQRCHRFCKVSVLDFYNCLSTTNSQNYTLLCGSWVRSLDLKTKTNF